MIGSGARLSRIGLPAGFLDDFGGPAPHVYATIEFQGEGGEDNPLWARIEMLAEMFSLRSRPAPAPTAAPRRAVQVLVDVTAGSPRDLHDRHWSIVAAADQCPHIAAARGRHA